jgi:hypothetical protein
MVLGWIQLLTEMSTRVFLGGKAGRCVGLIALPPSRADESQTLIGLAAYLAVFSVFNFGIHITDVSNDLRIILNCILDKYSKIICTRFISLRLA